MFLTRIRSIGTSPRGRRLVKMPGQPSAQQSKGKLSFYIYIPSIVVAELHYVDVKLGRPLNFTQEFQRLATAGQFRFVDFKATDVLQFDALSAIPEMHDRIVVGVARALGLPLLTRDQAILDSDVVQTIW